MKKRFIFYGIMGWAMEIIWTGAFSLLRGNPKMEGYTSLWMFFIYGSAVFILEPVHNIIQGWSWPVRGTLWVIIIWGMEYVSGAAITLLVGVCPWFYTGPFAVDNLIRLDFAPAWFAAGLIFEQAHHVLDSWS